MIRMGKETKLDSAELIAKAVAYFGPEGLGLEIEERSSCCARFAGGGGYVFVQGNEDESPGGMEVIVEGREWENQIRQFMGRI